MANQSTDFIESIFKIKSQEAFNSCAIQLFKLQSKHCLVYSEFIKKLGIEVENVKTLEEIPFLPIDFFKSHKIVTGTNTYSHLFTSSGTTGLQTSSHYISDISLYEKSFLSGFNLFYGLPKEYHILALLPNYIEQGGSSLVYMVQKLIALSGSEHSNFYLHDLDTLANKLTFLDNDVKKVLLIGVSYALLDLIHINRFELKNTLIMETGGMKGKRKELVKEALHKKLQEGFGVTEIHSEYGMTELLSQAYSKEKGLFACPPWMKILIRDINDPFAYKTNGKSGGINVIDLANINSCAFIATQDLGKIYSENIFEILGRYDNSDIRGCNLMIE